MNAFTAIRALRSSAPAFTSQSRSYAKATLIGRLGAAPTQRETSNGRVYFTYPLAVSRPPRRDASGKVQLDADGFPVKETDWYTIFNFSERAGDSLPQLETGSLILVDATVSTRTNQIDGADVPAVKETIFRESSHRVLSKAKKE